MSKRVLILGIGGMDGSYLAEILLEAGCEVHGLARRSSADNLFRIRHLLDRVTLHNGDLTDAGSLAQAVRSSGATDVYNMADQDHVGFSLAAPQVSVDVTYGGVQNLLEVARDIHTQALRIFQPLSITMFGMSPAPQNEESRLDPQSPYACAKVGAWMLCKHYRREHGLDVRCAIFANHDSPRRQGDYLLHKICRQAIKGKVEVPDVTFDLSFAGDLMHDAVSIMSLPEPDDFVLGADEEPPHSSDLAVWVLYAARAPLISDFVVRKGDRPGPQPTFVADCAKARSRFNLHPRKPLRELVGEIVEKYRREQS